MAVVATLATAHFVTRPGSPPEVAAKGQAARVAAASEGAWAPPRPATSSVFHNGQGTARAHAARAAEAGNWAPPRPATSSVYSGDLVGSARVHRVPYEAGWELYDDGWAGGPGPKAVTRSKAAMVRVPYEAGWELYDNGWAGGPGPKAVTPSAPAVSRVPYEAGWELYDNGWAGGPNTLPQR